MKNSLRKSLIVALTAIVAMLFVIVMALNVNVAKADAITITIPEDAIAPRVTGEWIDDFYVIDGGSVRRETEGLKFTTVISKAYLQHLEGQGTVEFFATAKKAGGTAQAVTFKYQPTSATMPNDTFNLNTYLNFDKYEGDMDAALATEFIIETYAKITPNEGDPTYVRAYKPEGNDISRSMRAVANMASIEGMAGLEKYFGSRVDIHKGYGAFIADTTIENKNHIDLDAFKGVTITSDTIDLYVGSVKYTCQVADGKIILPQLEGLNNLYVKYVTIFANGKAYTAKVDICTTYKELNSTNYSDIFTITDEYVVITENLGFNDFEMDDTNYSNTFSGVLDGQGYSLGSIRCRSNKGVFKILSGSLKNLYVSSRMRGDQGGILVHDISGEAFIQNVSAYGYDVATGVTNGFIASGVDERETLYLENVILYGLKVSDETGGHGYAVGYNYGTIDMVNCYFSGYGGKVVGSSSSQGTITDTSTYTIYDSLDECLLAAVNNLDESVLANYIELYLLSDEVALAEQIVAREISDEVKETVVNKLIAKGYNLLWEGNFTNLLTATGNSENWYLIDDIDLAGIDWNPTAAFRGTFDGRQHEIRNIAGRYEKGLFKTFGGTIKNLAVIDADMSDPYSGNKERAGVLIGSTNASTTIENVYVSTTGKLTNYAGIVQYSVHSVTFKDVVAVCGATGGGSNCGTLMGRASATKTLDNCYIVKGTATYGTLIVAGNNRPSGDLTISGTEGTNYFIYDEVSDLVADTNAKLNDFLRSYLPQE